MLETIREFAAERLADQPELAARGPPGARDLLHGVSPNGSWRMPPAQEGEPALAALAGEIENLRAAWRYWVATDDLEQLDRPDREPAGSSTHAEGRYQSTA